MSQELTRNKLQEKAMQILYSHLLLEQLGKSKDIVTLIEESCDLPFDEVDVFLKLSLVKAIKYKDELIEYATPYLRRWKFNRLNLTIQSILILSLTHYKFFPEMEKPIIIDVAVKLAKKYGDVTDYKFVNGILDNCLNDNLRK